MNFRRLVLTHRNEKGITLVELLVAMLVTGIITASITGTLWQVFTINSRSLNHMTAIRQTQSAGYWVSHDALMAQSITTSGTASGLPMTLTWTDWDGTPHKVTYSIDDGNSRLERLQEGAGESAVARYIVEKRPTDSNGTSCNFTNGKLIFTVKAKVGSGSTAGTELRVYEVTPRTGQ
ncbi:MAG: prepilin-type N-terminal cleavage/methylation domain-containing protein [Dehalococcoidales bacterium]|nr:prepilin-type N-terminal cleavage/methylation domain-containing protein [Dehalococcoidales bacterium]